MEKKLLDRVRDVIRRKHYSIRTEEAYVGWIKRFIFFHKVRHPLEMGVPEIVGAQHPLSFYHTHPLAQMLNGGGNSQKRPSAVHVQDSYSGEHPASISGMSWQCTDFGRSLSLDIVLRAVRLTGLLPSHSLVWVPPVGTATVAG